MIEAELQEQQQKVATRIQINALYKYYAMGRTVVPALRGINLEIKHGEFVAIMGPSGSGKSTFMNILGCLDRPTKGEYRLDGVSVGQMSNTELADVRNQKIGFIFQSFNLLRWMSAQANVELPLVYAGISKGEREARARLALSLVGLTSRANHRPMELSGGQQQRVAIARSLVTSPSLILADEPTGNLDSHTSLEIMRIMQELNARGMTIVLVTHEQEISDYCQRKVTFRDGRVVDDMVNPRPLNAREQLSTHTSTEQV
ncbi:ABC transporter ATP-binding protein [Dictyobacter aurantiacus]|uniref:ABC transporter ATP-binding protein n=1 Tax=Dictyobacter aurantiacus TaxID=1936993 RepID=A0A401ZF61_9CHLR|nr:ABC transporter ATP-binding protein [Dictyobacter aurantiacus]GCE05505.1 ABC transporter ATP-binding protein [Dictyobacter aurantiacus]